MHSGASLLLYVLPAKRGFLRVGLPGLEPGTSSLSEKRSNRLSYRPEGLRKSPPGKCTTRVRR
jgi:hypothetical protein